jgi:hypothetical protein
MSLPRLLAWIHLVYGCVAVLVGGLGGVVALIDMQTARGCSGMVIGLYAVLLIALAAIGLPQAWCGWRYLRGAASGARWLALLSIVNLILNFATAALFTSGGVPDVGIALLPAVVVNVLTLIAMRRESAQPSTEKPL